MELTDLDQSQHIFSLMGQIVTILGFVRHMVSVVTPQLCHYSAKAARDNTCMNRYGYVPIKLYLQNQGSLLTLNRDYE